MRHLLELGHRCIGFFMGSMRRDQAHLPGTARYGRTRLAGWSALCVSSMLPYSSFAIDPANHKACAIASDESLRNTIAVNMAPDGYLYYGSDADLMRCKLIP